MIQSPMLIVIGYHSGDLERTQKLLSWIKELGGARPHSLLLVVDDTVNQKDRLEVSKLAKDSFDFVATIPSTVKCQWKPNEMFLSAAKWISECARLPWLWLEPDATPIREGWADSIMEEYEVSPMLFLGPLIKQTNQPTLPAVHLTGTAVYPFSAWELYKPMEKLQTDIVAWDMEAAGTVVPRSRNSVTIAHYWGEKDLPPSFVEVKSPDSPKNHVTLEFIPKSAVLFHRCKDGSLINLLRKSKKVKPSPATSKA